MKQVNYSTVGFTDRDIEAALDAVAAAGFTGTEIVGQAPHLDQPPEGQALIEFRERLDSRGLLCRTVHAPLTRNVLGAPEEEWRQEVVEVLARYVRFAGAIEADGIVIHPIPNPIFVPAAEDASLPDRMRSAVRRSLDDLVPVAREAGVCMLLENLPYHCHYPLLTLEELRPLIDGYPEQQVGLVIDTGHAWTIGRDPAVEIRAAGARLRGTHLQDVDGEHPNDDHWPPTQGGLNWDDIRQALEDVSYEGFWTFEVANGRQGETPEELARVTRQVAGGWGI
jgi:sugar phosphate isomerase/epimerase